MSDSLFMFYFTGLSIGNEVELQLFYSKIVFFLLVGLFGMKQSTQLCHH